MDQYIHGIAVAARGVPVTLIISLVAVLGGLVLGLLVALAKRSKFKILRGIATVYVDILRGTPLLVQVLILGYGVPQLVRAITGMQPRDPAETQADSRDSSMRSRSSPRVMTIVTMAFRKDFRPSPMMTSHSKRGVKSWKTIKDVAA